MDDHRSNGHMEARTLLVWALSRMDLRLAQIERATGLPEQWQFVEINQLAETMGLEPGYDRIKSAARQIMTSSKVLTGENWR
jgi:hypothetical protein